MENGFVSCSAFTRIEEGGYVADRRDSGNWTSGRVGIGTLVGSNMGVGAPALTAWIGPDAHVTADQMRRLSLSTYHAIARCKYWTPLGCGELADGLDLMVFDFGWNRGIGTSLDVLKRCLGSHVPTQTQTDPIDFENALAGIDPRVLLSGVTAADVRLLQSNCGVEVDGIVGPLTIQALAADPKLLTKVAIMALYEAQVASYRRLINFPIYGSGWLARSTRRKSAALAAVDKTLVRTPRLARAAS